MAVDPAAEPDALVGVLAGLVQGLLEWLPVSSEGGVALVLAAAGRDPAVAVRFALVLHAGTALAALAYYRAPVRVGLVRAAGGRLAPAGRFVVVATLASGVVGIAAYAALEELLAAVVAGGPERAGGAFLGLVGVALVATGVLQRIAGRETGDPAGGLGARPPALRDAVLVGCLQGLAVVPGISRSGVTVGALLLRGYDGPTAFRLSFLLAIPASVGAAGLALADGAVPALAPATLLALGVAAAVGYLTVDALLRVARELPFWAVCVALGTIAVASGLLAM